MSIPQGDRAPVPYIRRTHEYYAAQGFDRRYEYAHFDSTPFTPLPKPLNACTVGLVTTASTYARLSLEPRKVNSGPTSPRPTVLYTSDLSWDKQSTHTDDVNTFCPVEHLQTLVVEGVIGALASRFHCAPTEYSQRTTLEQDAPEIHRRLLEDGADLAVLVPL